MTPASHPSPSSNATPLSSLLAIDRDLHADELAELTRRIVDTSELWRPLVRHDPDHRWYERLLLTPRVEVWLIGWAPGQGTLPHDHGDAEGAMTVAEGVLTEDRYLGVTLDDADVHPSTTKAHRRGTSLAFPADHVHRVTNRGQVNATSVHAYSPPGRAMRFYGAAAQRASSPDQGTVEGLLARARRRLTRLSPAAAAAAVREGALLVDIRPDEQRRREGTIPGALVVERNVLEWRLDPVSPWRLPQVRSHDQLVILVCSEGYASSVAAAALQELGLTRATDLAGGFQAWAAAGLPTGSI